MSVGQAGNHSHAPQVVMDELVYQKIMHWVNKSSYEVSGLGKLVVENGVIRIIDAILLPQKNTSTTTDIEGADVARAMYLLRDTPGELKFWWHSHVNMNVFWSGTDIATIKALGEHGWFVHTVFNKRHETKTCISMNDPFPLIYDDIKLAVERHLPSDLVNQWDKEYEDKVTNTIPKPVPVVHSARFPSSTTPVFSQEEREEITRLAQLMGTSDDEDEENLNFPGLGSDGVYGDSDWPGNALANSSASRQHSRGEATVQDILARRDKLEDKIQILEQRVDYFTVNNKTVPTGLERALEVANSDLEEIEDELDVLETHGIITAADRVNQLYAHD